MNAPIGGSLNSHLKLADALVVAARELTRLAQRHMPPRSRPKRGSTLRPGAQTPMWNALVLATRPYLSRRGEKSKLARLLGVPPQRIHDYFTLRRAAPDAERTLLLLSWLAQRQAGVEPVKVAPPHPAGECRSDRTHFTY